MAELGDWVPLGDEVTCAQCGLRSRPVQRTKRSGEKQNVVLLTGGYPGAELTGPRRHAGFGKRCAKCLHRPPTVVAYTPALVFTKSKLLQEIANAQYESDDEG